MVIFLLFFLLKVATKQLNFLRRLKYTLDYIKSERQREQISYTMEPIQTNKSKKKVFLKRPKRMT